MNKVGKFLIACSILGFVRGIFALGNPKGSNYFGPIFFSAFVIGIIGFILYKTGKSSSKKDKITKNKQVDIEHKETFLRNNKNESTNHSNEKIDMKLIGLHSFFK